MLEEIKSHLFENFTLKNGEIKRKDGSRKILKDHELVKELGAYADDNDKDWSKQERLDGVVAWKKSFEEARLQPKENPIGKYISSVFSDYDIKILPNRDFAREGVVINEDDVRIKLEAGVPNWNRENPECRVSVPELKSTLEDLKSDMFFNTRKTLIEELSYNEEYVETLEKFLKDLHTAFKIQESYEIFSTMMKHFMWTVKRRMNNKDTINQVLVNFYGQGGTGKSYFMKFFTEVFKMFRVMNAKIETVTDERRVPELANNFIHFIDELAGEKKVYIDQDLSIFKSIITADTPLTYRPMGTNSASKIQPRTTLISCSNFHIFDVILDSSGMRRFFEFNIGIESHGYNKADFDALESICGDSWKGIDEENDNGYWITSSEIGKEIINIQETYRRKESFDLWLESIDITDGSSSGVDVYENYKKYCQDEGIEHKTKSIQTFYSKLQSIGIKISKTNGKTFIRASITNKSGEGPVDFLEHLKSIAQEPKKKNSYEGVE